MLTRQRPSGIGVIKLQARQTLQIVIRTFVIAMATDAIAGYASMETFSLDNTLLDLLVTGQTFLIRHTLGSAVALIAIFDSF